MHRREMKQRIGVFLSSKSDLPISFHRAAEEVGAWIGQTGRTLIYGGSRSGLMEVLAQSAARNGGHVIGVVPQIIVERGLVSDVCHVTIHTADLTDRKAAMMRESDVLLALPGGMGTLDEAFTVLGASTIGISKKHLVLYNVDGCWDTLLRAIDDLTQRGLIKPSHYSQPLVAQSIEDLERLCQ